MNQSRDETVSLADNQECRSHSVKKCAYLICVQKSLLKFQLILSSHISAIETLWKEIKK